MMHWAIAALLALATSAPGNELPAPEQIMAVPPDLQTQLQEQVVDRSRSRQQRLELLVDFVFSDEGLGLEYEVGATRTVAETWESGKVNCLSFALLFVALAREAGLDAQVQEIDQVLLWYQEHGIIYSSNHVNAGVRIGSLRRTVEVAGGDAIIARHRPEPIGDQRAFAHFYNNRGAELMAQGDMVAARRHMREAIALQPDYATSWNNFGVLNLRDGDPLAAESAYLHALELDPAHSPALFNIVRLYRHTGDTKLADLFQNRLERAQRKDPFHQFLLATGYESSGDYANAVTHYRRAIRLHGSEHRFHYGLARAYFLLGDNRRAGRALARARALGDDETRARYQAKIDSLRAR